MLKSPIMNISLFEIVDRVSCSSSKILKLSGRYVELSGGLYMMQKSILFDYFKNTWTNIHSKS